MSAVSATAAASRHAAEPTSSGKSLGWWGVWVAIVTEATLFALLLFSYFYLRQRSATWPPPGIEAPKLGTTSIRSLLLVGSSVPAQLAERAVRRGRLAAARRYLVISMLMALVFLAGHVKDTISDWDKFRPSTNAYGSLYYTILNLHALHLIVGLAFLLYVLVGLFAGRYGPERHEPVGVAVLYWHFVDGVWVAVFSALYLSVRLW